MVRGLYTSALGMTTQMNKMNVLTNNIANIDTNGYKKDTVVTRSFSEELMNKLDDPGELNHHKKIGKVDLGVFVDDIHTDFSKGNFVNTGSNLDLAISGSGFFCVSKLENNGESVERYTRDGAFTVDPKGRLITKTGEAVQGEDGDIILPDGEISVGENGNISVNGKVVGKLKVEDFVDTHTLRKTGDNLYSDTETSERKEFSNTIWQGFLESSNINPVKEMVELITVNRTYEANQKLIAVHDSTLAKAVNEIGRK